MNIMVHAISTSMGGAKRHLDNLVHTLKEERDENNYFIVINNRYDCSWDSERTKALKVPAKYSNGPLRIYFDNYHINRMIKEYDIDVLISFANFGPFKAACRHILFEMNALYFCETVRKMLNSRQHIDFALKRFLIKASGIGSDLIVTPSQSLKNQLIESLGFSEEKIAVLHHAIEQNFNKTDKAIFQRTGENTVFLYPSHLARHKGVHILLDALIEIKKQAPSLPFEIVCTFERSDSPAYYDELMKKIEHYKLDRYIKFIGSVKQNEINSLYASCDYMIYTTLCESFGFSMIEAKAFRLPSLCSDIPINREIAKRSAKYYEAENPSALAKSIIEFVTQKPKDFDFDDELLNWDWVKYTDALRNLIKRVAT